MADGDKGEGSGSGACEGTCMWTLARGLRMGRGEIVEVVGPCSCSCRAEGGACTAHSAFERLRK